MAAAGVLHPAATLLKQSPPRSILMSSAITLAWNALEASPEALLKEPRALQSEDWRAEDEGIEDDLTDDEEGLDDNAQDLDQEAEEMEIAQQQDVSSEQAFSEEQQTPAITATSEMDQAVSMSVIPEPEQPGDALPGEPSPLNLSQDKWLSQVTPRQPLKVRNSTITADVDRQRSLKPRSKQRIKAKQPASVKQSSREDGSRLAPSSTQGSLQSSPPISEDNSQQAALGGNPRSSFLGQMRVEDTLPPLDLSFTSSQAVDMDRLDSQLQALDMEDLAQESEDMDEHPIDIEPRELGARMRARKTSQLGPLDGTVTFSYEDARPLDDIDAEPSNAEQPAVDQSSSPSNAAKGRNVGKAQAKRARPLTAGTDKSKSSSAGRRRMVRSDSEGSGWASHSGGGVAHALADAISQLLQWAMREGRCDADRILASDAMSLALVLAQQAAGHQGAITATFTSIAKATNCRSFLTDNIEIS